MRRLGISVYVGHNDAVDIKNYIAKAAKYKFSRIFMCLISLGDDAQKRIHELKDITSFAKNLGFEIIADINPSLMNSLKIKYNDLSFFKELHLDGIRLDEGFSGNEESLMTYNPEGLKIEINASANSGYIDNIMSYYPDVHNLIACHNFYPKPFSALSREVFLASSLDFQQYGIKLAAFVSSSSAKTGPWELKDGLPTLEEHRNLPIDIQAKDLFYFLKTDDVIIGNAFAKEEELVALSNINPNLITLDAILNKDISEVEKTIATKELHFFRGDAGKYSIRSTLPRVKYKEATITPTHTQNIKYGDIIVENSNSTRYKGELLIALKDYKNDGSSNIIGRVTDNNLAFVPQILPWQKFMLKATVIN